jgi:uncharacterized protein YndB with AHSA1/START domain
VKTTATREKKNVSVRFERPMKHAIEKVWTAITERDHVNEWFPNDIGVDRITADTKTLHYSFRGEMEFSEEDLKELGDVPMPKDEDGDVLEFDPPRLLVLNWYDGILRFELSATADGGTLLVFTHTVEDDGSRPARDSAGWQICLENLDESLGGPPASKPDIDAMKKLMSKYASMVS